MKFLSVAALLFAVTLSPARADMSNEQCSQMAKNLRPHAVRYIQGQNYSLRKLMAYYGPLLEDCGVDSGRFSADLQQAAVTYAQTGDATIPRLTPNAEARNAMQRGGRSQSPGVGITNCMYMGAGMQSCFSY